MKKQLLIATMLSALAFNGCAGEIDRKAIAENIKNAIEFSAEAGKEFVKLRDIQYSDPDLFKSKYAAYLEKKEGFDMASVVYSAIALIDQDPSGPAGFDALMLLSREFNAVRKRTEADIGKMDETQIRELLNNVLAKAAEHHADNDQLFSVLPVPLMMVNGSEGYAVPKAALQQILKESKNRSVRGQAAYELASNAIGASKSPRESEGNRRQASMDIATYSDLVMTQYADVKTWSGKTVKEQLEGKLFSLNSLVPGKVLPDVEAKNLEDELDRLTNYRGKVVLIDFWATWCTPCKAALPGIAKLKEELAGKPFEVISISVDDDVDDVVDYQENEQPMPWVNWHIGPDSDILTEWNVRAYPTYYVVDAEGVIKSNRHIDDTVKDQIRELVNNTAK